MALKTSPFLVKSFSRPRIVLQHDKVINSDTNLTRYALLNAEWEPVNISLMDFQNTEYNSTNNTWTWLTNNGYNSKAFAGLTGDDLTGFFSQMNNVQGLGGGLATLKILHIDDKGKEFESWEFLDPRLLEITFGDVATYDTDALLTVDIRFNVAAAEYVRSDSGSNRTPGVARSDGGPFTPPAQRQTSEIISQPFAGPSGQTSIFDGPNPGVNFTPGPAPGTNFTPPAPNQSGRRDG